MTLKHAGRPTNRRMARRMVQFAGFGFYLLAVQALVTAAIGLQIYLAEGSSRDLQLPCISGILAFSYAHVGFHLRRYRLWARNFGFAFAGISLFAVPVGTGLGLLIIGLVAGANRARIFPEPLPRPAAPEQEWPLLRFEPELVSEQAG